MKKSFSCPPYLSTNCIKNFAKTAEQNGNSLTKKAIFEKFSFQAVLKSLFPECFYNIVSNNYILSNIGYFLSSATNFK